MAMASKEYRLGTFDGLWEATDDLFGEQGGWPPSGSSRSSGLRGGPVGNLYCPVCGEQRRMFLVEVYIAYRAFYRHPKEGGIILPKELWKAGLHAVFGLRCVQCDAGFTAVMYDGPNGNFAVCSALYLWGASNSTFTGKHKVLL
jgi:hypothetical protein